MKRSTSTLKIFPVMFGFLIMGFVDIIGIAINYIKQDFTFLNDSMANLLTMSCFLWFLILSVPTGMLMNRVGRKKTVLLSFILQIVAFSIPLIDYSFSIIMIAFAAIGIGNTILQVALNPLVTNVVSNDKLTGTLTLGQFVKSISSFLGPIIAGWAVGSACGWKMIFPIYAATSLLASVWLALTPIKEESSQAGSNSFAKTFGLLKDKYILTFFLGILILVGADVGINTTFPKLLMERSGLALSEAGLGNSLYFFARMAGAFAGGILLMKYSEKNFYLYSVFLAIAGLIAMILSPGLGGMLIGVVVFGLGYSNLFSIIFSLAMQRMPSNANEISSLLIMGVSGGAVIPPILGIVTDLTRQQWSAIAVIAIFWIYLVWLIKIIRDVKTID